MEFDYVINCVELKLSFIRRLNLESKPASRFRLFINITQVNQTETSN